VPDVRRLLRPLSRLVLLDRGAPASRRPDAARSHDEDRASPSSDARHRATVAALRRARGHDWEFGEMHDSPAATLTVPRVSGLVDRRRAQRALRPRPRGLRTTAVVAARRQSLTAQTGVRSCPIDRRTRFGRTGDGSAFSLAAYEPLSCLTASP
jgi:hypothetical protein